MEMQAFRHRRKASTIVQAFLSAAMLLSALTVSNAGAQTPFDAAVKSYQSRNYRQAITQLTALRATYPTNGLVHYYLALSYQGVGNRGQAKAEYEWLVANDRTQLKQMAEKGLQMLGGATSSSSISTSSSSSGSAPSTPPAAPKVKTIIDFYTDWCGPCKKFEPIFEEAKRKFPDITFKRLNAEDTANAALVEKYGVKAYPTIVQLDGSGNVLRNEAGAPSTAEAFERQIQQNR
jgi:thioredoxin 1